jgi:hypothetical protein
MTKPTLPASSLLVLLIALNGCSSMDHTSQNMATETHQAQVRRERTGMIYIDEIPCNNLVREDTIDGNYCFRCYTVGFVDSLLLESATGKKTTKTGKYFQYDVQHDWTALVDGDSVKPVFFHPKQVFKEYRNEGILVFETLLNKKPDLLLYNDSYGSWGAQQFRISNKKTKD